tara:strand:+ start:77 stop:1201 length:1125 start_codon:yes stop_codon:yes gene_type:complete
MLKLIKNTSDWKEWIVQLNNEQFILGDHASMWDEGIYNFPEGAGVELSIKSIANLASETLPSELQLHIENEGNILGKYIYSVLLNTSKGKQYLGYTWEIKADEWDGHLNPYLIRDMMFEILKNDECYSINIDKKSAINNDEAATLFFDVESAEVEGFWNNKKEQFGCFLNDSVKLAEDKVAVGGFINKVVAKFSFTDKNQQAITAYLLYFIEFLSDLGIETESEINKENGNLLFSIEPKNKENALHKISEALSFYLKLPTVNISEVSDSDYDPIVQLKFEKLKSEIERLKSNQRINEALLRYQDSLLINTSNEKSVSIIESQQNTPTDALTYIYTDDKKQDKKEFLSGGIKLGVFKKAGVEIDLSALISHFWSK